MVCSPTVLEVVTERMLTEPLRKRRDIVKAKSLFTFVAVAILTAFSAAQQSAAPALQGNITDAVGLPGQARSEEHTSELQSPYDLVCRLLLEKKKKKKIKKLSIKCKSDNY